ncbi:MAG: glycosyltransferase family 4 protein [Acidaminococcaceae bacterium]|nr:glycosyltransferase family 4 protein [Acidaminococcaceae bacterium]
MKIVHVMNWYIPGMGYQENFLPAEQKKLGHDVYIIASDRVPQYKGYEANVGKTVGGRVIGVGSYQESGVTVYRLATVFEVVNGGQVIVRGLYKLLKELKPDVVQAHGAFCPLTLQVLLYSKRLKYRVFVDDHSNIDNFHLNSFVKRAYVQLVKIFYRFYGNRVEMFFPVTFATTDFLKCVLKIPENRLEVLPLGANTDRFKKSLELRKMGRNELNIKEDEKLILTAGKLDAQKDIEYLIKAFSDVNNRKPFIKLLIIGSGTKEYMNNLKSLVNRLGVQDRVIFIDFVPNKELPRYYNAGDIGVWPGNCSITVLEAVATGLPVIIPNKDLNYKILTDNNAAVGFKRRNVNSLSEAILKLLNDSEWYSRIIENTSRLFIETLSWKGIARKSTSIYFDKRI